jgi:hypothetical protein
MAGILDLALASPDGFDPQSQGILKAAFALMAAGAPTRTPTGMGEALGQAGTAGIDAFEKAKQGQAAELQRKLQSAKLASELQMQKDLEQNGGILNSTDPEKMKAVGMRLAAAGIQAALHSSTPRRRSNRNRPRRNVSPACGRRSRRIRRK